MADLKRCPFCGGEAGPGCEFGLKRMHHFGRCKACGARGQSFPEDEGGAAAAATAWNERTFGVPVGLKVEDAGNGWRRQTSIVDDMDAPRGREQSGDGAGMVQTPGMPAKLSSVSAALNMCMQANSEVKLPVPICWDLALYVKRLEDAVALGMSAAPATPPSPESPMQDAQGGKEVRRD